MTESSTSDLTALPPGPTPEAELAEIVLISPRWGVFTKFLVSLVFVVLVGALLVRFQQMIAPLVMAVILTYLLRPIVLTVVARTGLSWHFTVALLYALLVILLITLLTIAGIAVIQQMQGLYTAVLHIASSDLPTQVQHLLSAPFAVGPFMFDLSKPIGFGQFQINLATINWQPIYNQALNAVQPALNGTGTLISSLAGKAAETIAWMLFILIISFYLLFDWNRIAVSLDSLAPNDYAHDVHRLFGALVPIWHAFLRGQITMGIVMGLAIGLTMTALGVPYAGVLGLIGALLQFVPIIGPLVYGTTAVAIVLFTPGLYFGLSPVTHAVIVLLGVILLQQLSDNVLGPRIIGGSLHLHPVAILVGAVIAANLAGIVGLLLSAPTLATLRLFGWYVYCKMFDLNPWPDRPPMHRPPPERTWFRWVRLRVTSLRARR
jgi:predicted PurR-regulated permease PerM